MNKPETTEKKNLLVELAKRKSEAQTSGGRFGILGKDISKRFSQDSRGQSYTWRGGRNGSGKP